MKLALIGRYGVGDIITGPERVARELFSELRKNNIQVEFIEYFFSGYKNSSFVKKLFGKEISTDNSVNKLGIFRLIIFLKREKFDVIHIVNLQRFILILLILKTFLGIKIITTFHGLVRYEISKNKNWTKRYFLDKWTEKFAIKKSDQLIFPSKLLLEHFEKYYKLSNKIFRIIPNGVSDSFNTKMTDFPSAGNALKLIFYNGYGELINTGLDELLNLLNSVNAKIELYVIGKIPNQSSRDNLKVIYVEPKNHDDFKIFLRDKHFIIKGPTFDSFSIIVAECMSVGLIPIINDKIGIKDFMEDKVNGFKYDYSIPDELARLLNEICIGNYDLNLISSNAKKIYSKLNWQTITNNYVEAYKSIL